MRNLRLKEFKQKNTRQKSGVRRALLGDQSLSSYLLQDAMAAVQTSMYWELGEK